ncbi:hypothetical protein [Alishewanella sp. HL-SH05]|uniref:hypothetical protein n=1 Tax=Alishewanella sp. HL-SH05 TaxID=3461145 RepID=UPI00404218C7
MLYSDPQLYYQVLVAQTQEVSGVEVSQPSKIQNLDKEEKLEATWEVQAVHSIDHSMFFKDELDIHFNPKIGTDFEHRGKQCKVATSGQNKKHYLA